MDDRNETSGPAKQDDARHLTAGPIRFKFEDGELRYLYVGDKEIVRRVYFAVRDGNWATAPPKFTQMDVRVENGWFRIDVAATCKTNTTDFSWKGNIIGSPDGKIVFTASGAANQDFESNRIGLCVLFGTPSVTGQKFETVRADSTITPYTFPTLVSHELVSPDFQTLRYTTPDNLTVNVHANGARFDMEDQRSYADSSFKAYAPLPYNYKRVSQGDSKTESVTIEVTGTPENTPGSKPGSKNETLVRVGSLLAGVTVPQIGVANPAVKDAVFGSVNGKASQFKKSSLLSWGYRPNVHLADWDTAAENLPTILDQVKTARSYATKAKITIEPVSPGSVLLPESGAAWMAASVKFFALAGVDEAKFAVNGDANGPAQKMQIYLATLSGHRLYDVAIFTSGAHPSVIEAFATDENGPVLHLVNLSAQSQKVAWENTTKKSGGKMTLEIPPYTVSIVRGG